MANIPSTPTWSPDVLQIETSDAVLGGPDGVINVQAKQLADRTAFLKQELESAGLSALQANFKADQALTQIDTIEVAGGSAASSAMAALSHKHDAQAAQAVAEQARNAAQAAQAQAGDNAGFAYQASQTAQLKASEAQSSATAATVAASQAISERNQVVALGEQKKSEIAALADASLVELDAVRDDAVAAKDLAVVKAQDATTQASAATNQASVASGQANIATTQAGLATSAKAASEAARDAAQLSAGVYPTTAAGLAAVADGAYFSVPSASTSEHLILYRRAGSAATEIKRYPSSAAISTTQESDEYALSLVDDDGNILLGISRSGGIKTNLVEINAEFKPKSSLAVQTDGSVETNLLALTEHPSFKYAVADEEGNVLYGVNNEGQLVANFSLVPQNTIEEKIKVVGKYDFSINQVFGYGQSLSVGQATPALSTVQNHDSLMFTRGMRPQYDYPGESAPQWYAGLVPAVEAQSTTNGSLAETPSSGTADMIKERILAEDGKTYAQHEYQILISTPGYGATTIAQLSKGGVHFSRMIEQATYGRSLANAAGKTHAVQAVTWTQGESDYISNTTRANYAAALNTLIADINTDIQSAIGQTKIIPVIGYQVSSHINYAADDYPDIALAQLEVEESNPLFYIACAMYPFSYHSGGHISNVSTRWLGGYYGLAYKRIIVNGEDWKPLKPVSVVRQSNIVEISFHVPEGPLVFDTEQVSAQANYGFSLVSGAGAELAIISVEIVGDDRVRIKAAAPVEAGSKIRYAFAGDAVTGKGNLRDSQGDSITFGGIPFIPANRMDNWCLIFERTV